MASSSNDLTLKHTNERDLPHFPIQNHTIIIDPFDPITPFQYDRSNLPTHLKIQLIQIFLHYP